MAPAKVSDDAVVRCWGHRSHMHALIGYLEALKVTQGRHAGECLTVLNWQRQFLGMAFGASGDSSLSLARANGKSTFVAALGCAFLDGPLRQPRAEVVIVASSFLQARIVFDHLLGFMGERVGDRKVWRLWDSTQSARLLHLPTGASVRCIGSDPKRMHGLAPVLVLADEPAQWGGSTSEASLAALRTGLGKIPDSRLIALGTRPASGDHWFSRMLAGDRALTFAARPDDPPFHRRTWKRANPSLEIMPDLEDRLREEAKVARRDPVALASFEALRLNLGTSDTVEAHLLQSGTWKAAEGNAAAVGDYILGIDLGATEAMSAAAGFWPESGRLDGVACFGSEPGTKERGLRDGVGAAYSTMETRGELVLSPGRISDVQTLLGEVWERWGKPKAIVADRWRSAELRKALAQLDWPVVALVERGQGYRDGSEDVRGFKAAFLRGLVTPTRSLLLASAVANARTVSDVAGNCKLSKGAQGGRHSRSRDDAAAAAILCVALGWRKVLQENGPEPAVRSMIV